MKPYHGLTVEAVLALPARQDCRGRWRVFIGRRHPLSWPSGWQWRGRLIAMICLRRRLGTNEHVHHLDGNFRNDHPRNLSVVMADYHGAYHCEMAVLTEFWQDRLRELGEPKRITGYRAGPILSGRTIRRQ